MSFERELDRLYSRILDPKFAGDLLRRGGTKPQESGVIGRVIRAMDPVDWGLAVENARQRALEQERARGRRDA